MTILPPGCDRQATRCRRRCGDRCVLHARIVDPGHGPLGGCRFTWCFAAPLPSGAHGRLTMQKCPSALLRAKLRLLLPINPPMCGGLSQPSGHRQRSSARRRRPPAGPQKLTGRHSTGPEQRHAACVKNVLGISPARNRPHPINRVRHRLRCCSSAMPVSTAWATLGALAATVSRTPGSRRTRPSISSRYSSSRVLSRMSSSYSRSFFAVYAPQRLWNRMDGLPLSPLATTSRWRSTRTSSIEVERCHGGATIRD